MKNTLDNGNFTWEYLGMANRTFSFTKEDEKLIAALRKRLAEVYGKVSIIAVIRYALIETERHK